MNDNLTLYNFNRNLPFLQLSMNFNVENLIPEDGKVKLVCNIIERMDLSFISSACSKRGRKPAVDPITFLKIILFCYSEGIFHSRKIEDFCRYDLRAHFILEGKKAPDHSTICRFRNMLDESSSNILTEFVQLMIKDNHIDLKSLYIDGTKIESAANRYSFVWKKAVEKHQKSLMNKLKADLKLCDDSTLEQVRSALKANFHKVRTTCKKHKIVFVYGCGRRKPKEQKDYEYYEKSIERFDTYQRHLSMMEDRNSYSKTDIDATFMRMKDDHMRNGQLKPAYNIQLASSGGFIVAAMASQKTNDLHTLKPFLEQIESSYPKTVKNVVADAGYESTENYVYLHEKGLVSYIKPSNYEISKQKKTREDISKRENMLYIKQKDVYVCTVGKHLVRAKDQKKISSSGFEDILRRYICYECEHCEHTKECIRFSKSSAPKQKSIKFSPTFEKYQNQSRDNILTDEGIDHRINRSIQAEGAFAKIKDGLGYTRFNRKGMKKAVSDIVLVALGLNINKLLSKIQNNQSEIIHYKKSA